MKGFLIRNQILVLLAILSLGGCAHGEIPKWNGKIWAGDSSRAGIARAQDAEFIAANDPAFDSYLAMSFDDFRSFYTTYVLSCERWRKGVPMMSALEAWQTYKEAAEQAERVNAR